MPRYWAGPYNYQSAVAHVTAKQANRTSLNIKPYVKLTISPSRAYVSGTWRSSVPCITYLPDGRTICHMAGHSVGDNNLLHELTDIKYRLKGCGTHASILDHTKTTPTRQMKCNICRGYIWQGGEAEAILHELGCNIKGTTRLLNTGSVVTYSSHQWVCEAKVHYQLCYKCQGTGLMTVGGNSLRVKFDSNKPFVILPDGTPEVLKDAS